MSSPSKCPLSPWSTTDCVRRTIACAGDHGAECSSVVSSAPPATAVGGGGRRCRARIVRCSYSSTATDRCVVGAAALPSPTTRPSLTGHGGSGGNGDSGRRAAQETTATTKTSTSATATAAVATTAAAIRRGAGDAKTVADMLDLSASEMELVSQRPVSHVKVQDAAEVQNKFYKFGPLLGRGAFATVMLGTERTTGDKWAIKILNKAQCGATQLALFQREIRILRAVRHPNIIHLERVLESPSALFLVLELCLCELAEVAKKKTTFTENEVRRVVQCMSSAVTYLHHKDIVHRDLKLENLLVAANPADPNDKFYVKVTDFGLSVVRGGVGQENMLQETCGTPVYMAPELFGSRMYSQQCDIWAMGVIMYVMLTGKFPFEQKPNKPLPMVVAQEEPDFSGPAFKGDDKEPLKKLLRKMLEKNPAYRANAHDVETDPWTRNAPAEEAPAENAMELMRMWRKDLRQPSIRGSLGGFSSDRRSSRMSAIGGPPSVMGRDTRPRAGSLGQEIATTASGSVRRKVGKGRMPGETEGIGDLKRRAALVPMKNDPPDAARRRDKPPGAEAKVKRPPKVDKNIDYVETPEAMGKYSLKNRPEVVKALMHSTPRNTLNGIPRGLVVKTEGSDSKETSVNLLPSERAPRVVYVTPANEGKRSTGDWRGDNREEHLKEGSRSHTAPQASLKVGAGVGPAAHRGSAGGLGTPLASPRRSGTQSASPVRVRRVPVGPTSNNSAPNTRGKRDRSQGGVLKNAWGKKTVTRKPVW